MSQQYKTLTYNGTTILEAQYGTRGPASGRRWYVCEICALDWPEDQVDLSTGKPYGIPCGCVNDLE